MRTILQGYGFTVRGLEGEGDHLAIVDGLVLHVECKRQEVLRLPLWTRQASSEAPPGAVPLVAFRRSREPWQALVPAEHVQLGKRPCLLDLGSTCTLATIDGRDWIRTALGYLLEQLAHDARQASPQGEL